MNKRLSSLRKELGLTDSVDIINIKKIKTRVNHKLNTDLKERKFYMKQKMFKTILVTAVLAAFIASTALAAAFRWDEKLIEFFKPTDAQMEELKGAADAPMVSATDNGVTVTVKQTLADNHGIYVLYEIEAPDHFELNDDITWEHENLEAMFRNNGIGSYGSKTISQDKNKRTVLFFSAGNGELENQKLTLELSNLGYESHNEDYSFWEFQSLISCKLRLEWDFDYTNTSRTQMVNQKVVIGGAENNTFTKIEISPMSVWFYIESSSETLRSIMPVIHFKDGSQIQLRCTSDFNHSYSWSAFSDENRSGGISSIGYRFDKITDISEIESVTVGDVTVPVQ